MVRFSELRFSEDKRQLFISCFVESFVVYTGVYIKSISVEYYRNRISTGNPSSKAVKIYENTAEDDSVRTFSTCLSIDNELSELGLDSFDGGLFYVYVECDGYTGRIASVDCSWGRPVTTGVVLDWEKLYRIGMSNIDASLKSGRCGIDNGFVDFVIMWNELKLAVEACDYDTVESVWDTFNGSRGADVSFKAPCGCR